MPDIIRSSSIDSTVVATISSIADQSTLSAVSPTVSATVDGSPATITAWAWKVNGATTGISSSTTATPSYTPTTAGAKVITVDVTIDGVVYSSLPEIFTVGPTTLSVSIAAVADQLDLSAATLDSTVTGGVTPYTYAWTVDGATTGLSSSTAADPTYTPTAAGTPTAVVTVTDAAGQTAKASVTWTVGDASGFIRTHSVDWTAAGVAGTKTIGGGETLDGIALSYTTGGGGTPSIVAGGTGLVMTPNGASSISYEWAGNDTGTGTLAIGDEWTLYLAMDASLAGASDNRTLSFLNGTNRVFARFHYSSGYKVAVSVIRAGVTTELVFSISSHPRMIALRFDGTTAQCRYSTTAYAGTFPAFATMTKCMSTRTSNKYAAFDPHVTSDTADAPALTSSTARITVQGAAATFAAHEIRWRAAA